MRTLTLYSILLAIFLQVSLSAMQSEKDSAHTDDKIMLESSDGARYAVSKNILEESPVLKECYEGAHDHLIPIAGLRGEQISLLLPYLKRKSTADLERSLSEKNRSELISVLNAANYLDINFLLEPLQKELACRTDVDCKDLAKLNDNNQIDLSAEIVEKNTNRSIAKLLIDRHGGNVLKEFKSFPISLPIRPYKIAVSRDTQFLAALIPGFGVHLCKVKENKALNTESLNCNHKNIGAVAFNKASNKFITANTESIRLWDIQTNQIRDAAELESNVFKDYIVDIDENLIAYTANRLVHLWDIRPGKGKVAELDGHANMVWCMAAHDNGLKLLTGSSDCIIKEWDLRKLSEACQTFQGHNESIKSIAYEPTCQQFASGDDQGIIHVWDSTNGKGIRTLQDGSNGPIDSLIFGNKGRLISGSGQDNVKFWDVKAGQVKNNLENYSCPVGNRKGTKLFVIPQSNTKRNSETRVDFYRYHNTDKLDTIYKAKKALIASYKLQQTNDLK